MTVSWLARSHLKEVITSRAGAVSTTARREPSSDSSQTRTRRPSELRRASLAANAENPPKKPRRVTRARGSSRRRASRLARPRAARGRAGPSGLCRARARPRRGVATRGATRFRATNPSVSRGPRKTTVARRDAGRVRKERAGRRSRKTEGASRARRRGVSARRGAGARRARAATRARVCRTPSQLRLVVARVSRGPRESVVT